MMFPSIFLGSEGAWNKAPNTNDDNNVCLSQFIRRKFPKAHNNWVNKNTTSLEPKSIKSVFGACILKWKLKIVSIFQPCWMLMHNLNLQLFLTSSKCGNFSPIEKAYISLCPVAK